MKRYEKVFNLIEVIIIALLLVIWFLLLKDGFELYKIIVSIIALVLMVIASALNLTVLAFQRGKDK